MLGVALVVTLVAGCGAGDRGAGSAEKVRVAATISVIEDMVENVGGDRVEVSTIVPVGGSPETFQPSPSDAGRISEARVVFENGLGLDAWVGDLLESAGGKEREVVTLSEGLPTIDGNPHLWLDVSNGRRYVEKIRDALVAADPGGADEYRANARRYLADLEELDGYVREQSRTIPEGRRKLVTVLDNILPYFARAYGFELVGTFLTSPNAEPGGREMADTVRKIREERVPAVFTTPQFNPGLADTIAREADVEVYELYSDTLTGDEAASSYEDMMRTNIDRIAEALG